MLTIDAGSIAHDGTLIPQRATALPAGGMLLSGAQIEHEAGDTFRMRLIAQAGLATGSLAHLPAMLKKAGFGQSYADVVGAQHVLVVHKLNEADVGQLTRWLIQNGLIAPDHITRDERNSSDLMKERFQRDTLKWSGRSAMLASAAVAAAGFGQKDYNRVMTGLGFMAADSIVAIYGNGKNAIDFDALFRDMHRHFTANGIELPTIASPKERRTAIEHIHDFIASHPVELNYSLGMLGGIGHIRSGMADFARSGAGISRMTKGVLGTTGSAGVVFLDEDRERQKNLKGIGYYLTHPLEAPQGAVDFFLASPIRFKGLLSSVYSALYLTDALEEGRKMKLWESQQGGLYQGKGMAQLQSELAAIVVSPQMAAAEEGAIDTARALKQGIAELGRREAIAKTFFGGKVTPYLSALTGISYIVSSLLAAASSKERDQSFERAGEYERMYAMAAQMLLPLAPAEREVALRQIATYLSAQKDVKAGEIHAPTIMAQVSERLELLEQSPWLGQSAPQPSFGRS